MQKQTVYPTHAPQAFPPRNDRNCCYLWNEMCARFMTPLADFLRLKMGVDVEPSEAEDKAAMLIDQVLF